MCSCTNAGIELYTNLIAFKRKDFNVLDLYTNYTDNPKMLDYKNMNNKINTINYWSTESAVAIVIIQIKKIKSLSKKTR